MGICVAIGEVRVGGCLHWMGETCCQRGRTAAVGCWRRCISLDSPRTFGARVGNLACAPTRERQYIAMHWHDLGALPSTSQGKLLLRPTPGRNSPSLHRCDHGAMYVVFV